MGHVISLADHRARRAVASRSVAPSAVRLPATVFFDVGSPLSYLAAERADRTLPGARWRPVDEAALTGRPAAGGPEGVADAERRADALGLPLVWPERWPRSAAAARRVAVLAAASGRGASFALAAGRLQFCGGFDLDDPELLAEAAAAAGLALDDALAAARDRALDQRLLRETEALRRMGGTAVPAFCVGHRLTCGEDRLAEVLAAAGHAPRPLAFPRWAQ